MSSQLQTLSEQFNVLLTQYTNTYQEYISLLGSNNNNLTPFPNFSFVGQSNITTLNNSNLDDCLNDCSANSSCSGATFNNTLNTCTLSSGSGSLSYTEQSTAIAQHALYYSYKLQRLNSQLTNVNQQIANINNSSYGQYQQTQEQNQQQQQILQSNYQTLQQEREQIEDMIKQFETANASYEDGNLNVTSNYYSFLLLVVVAIFLIIVLMKFSLTAQQTGGGWSIDGNKNIFYMFLVIVVIFTILSFTGNLNY
jgi:hypothetical protein